MKVKALSITKGFENQIYDVNKDNEFGGEVQVVLGGVNLILTSKQKEILFHRFNFLVSVFKDIF